MTQKERMEAGMLYDPTGNDILDVQFACMDVMYDYNATRARETEKRAALLQEMLGSAGENCYIEPPFYANWGGKHVHFGKSVYANFGLTVVDDANVYIGDYTMIGPHVTIATASHPIDPALRSTAWQYNKEVHIGKNVWIGSCAVILPGVTVGDNSVIGAGSVVNKDIPANVVAAGNPCRVLRAITEHDHDYYDHNRRIDYENMTDSGRQPG